MGSVWLRSGECCPVAELLERRGDEWSRVEWTGVEWSRVTGMLRSASCFLRGGLHTNPLPEEALREEGICRSVYGQKTNPHEVESLPLTSSSLLYTRVKHKASFCIGLYYAVEVQS